MGTVQRSDGADRVLTSSRPPSFLQRTSAGCRIVIGHDGSVLKTWSTGRLRYADLCERDHATIVFADRGGRIDLSAEEFEDQRG
jgi:hypothetical protein